MNPTRNLTITLSKAALELPIQDLTIKEDTYDTSQLKHLQDLPQQMHHCCLHSKRKTWTCEQKLMDEIAAMFGPHLVEIAVSQGTIRLSGASSDEQQRAPGQELGQGQSISTYNSLSSSLAAAADSACVATMLVPGLEPRVVNLSHANGVFSTVRLAWLRELKIVYRCWGALSAGGGGGGGGGGAREKACFLDATTFSSLAPERSRSSEGQEEREEGEEEAAVFVVDLSYCDTLEVLWIEDLDRNGQPHRLRSRKNSVKDLFALTENGADGSRKDDETRYLVPFARDQGLVLPGRLKSLTMAGLSANRFNFGWLRLTPKLETLNIHGMRFQIDLQQPLSTTCLWDIEGVFLPQLRSFSIHHAPARQFRFEVLKPCPRLVNLDVRDLCPGTVYEALVYPEGKRGAASASGGGRGSRISREESGGEESIFATKISTCRFELLHPNHNHDHDHRTHHIQGREMIKLLEWYFPRLSHLHLDGVPANLAIAITTGPPASRKQLQPNGELETSPAPAFADESETTHNLVDVRAAELPCLERVLTREKITAQEVLEYRLVPSMNNGHGGDGDVKDLEMYRMVEWLGAKTYAVHYTVGSKNWQRAVS
ncbi:hypothetical protein BGZ47_005928 [Haplosporangium gracile]|nr:hypothetical protein BGZ47_005928 [Haplosporangium gracile]